MVGESEFLGNLPRSDNPDAGFVGNPHDPWGYIPPNSYGVHAEPVAALLRAYGLQAESRRGLTWDDLRIEIAAGRPVIVWIIGQMWGGTGRAYTAGDGQVTTVAPFEHTMILIGYDPTRVQVVDSYSGLIQYYGLNAFLKSWAVLGNMAIFSQGKGEPTPTPARLQPTALTHTIQRGDYLVALAERHNTSWYTLATLNDIPYPYTLYPGQVLRLPEAASPPAATPPPTTEPEAPARTATPQPAQPDNPDTIEAIYTVRPGDYLRKIAEERGLDWRDLARLNGIHYPYIIYAGQVLRLR